MKIDHLLSLMLFQTYKTSIHLQNTNEYISSLHQKFIPPKTLTFQNVCKDIVMWVLSEWFIDE